MLRDIFDRGAIVAALPTPLGQKFGLIAKREWAIRPHFSRLRASTAAANSRDG
jgi:hypothetical protein